MTPAEPVGDLGGRGAQQPDHRGQPGLVETERRSTHAHRRDHVTVGVAAPTAASETAVIESK